MKIAVIGSRTFEDQALLEKTLSAYQITTLVSGGAIGADKMAENYARSKGIPTQIIKPDYVRYPSKVAPIMRNKDIVQAAEQVIAFHDGKSKGTMDAVNYAKKLGKIVELIPFTPTALALHKSGERQKFAESKNSKPA